MAHILAFGDPPGGYPWQWIEGEVTFVRENYETPLDLVIMEEPDFPLKIRSAWLYPNIEYTWSTGYTDEGVNVFASFVDSEGSIQGVLLCRLSLYGDSRNVRNDSELSLIPIFDLRDELEVSSGDGTKENPYRFSNIDI